MEALKYHQQRQSLEGQQQWQQQVPAPWAQKEQKEVVQQVDILEVGHSLEVVRHSLNQR